MHIPETIIAEEVLPEVRRSVSRSLTDMKWSQSKIAEILSTSQAMISKYLHDDSSCSPSLLPVVEKVSKEVLLGILAGEGISDISSRFCSSIDECMKDGLLAERFRERFGTEPHPYCFSRGSSGGRTKVLNDLNSSLELLRGSRIPDLIPAVKINMVQGIDSPSSVDDIASFPGRLIDRKGTITGANPPEFGASNHLARILILAMERDNGIRSAASIAYTMKLNETIHEGDVVFIRRDNGEVEMLPADLTIDRFLCDPGDFGVEPCLYIFGTTSLDVAMRILDLQKRIDKGVA